MKKRPDDGKEAPSYSGEGLSRRKFIEGAALASATLGVASGAMSASPKAAPSGGPDYDVIVIGGGFAGASAARDTSKSGLKTLLLEARNRLGGRTFYTKFGEHNVEMGGNYIYWLQPAVWAEVQRYQLPIADTPAAVNPDRWVYLKNGKPKEADIPTFWPQVDRAMEEFCAPSRTVFPRPDNPLFNDEWKKYESMSVKDRLDQMSLDEDVMINLNATWTSMGHARPEESSYLDMLRWWAALASNSTDFNNGISRYKFANGTISLINAMLDDSNVEVQLSSPVSDISQSKDTVRVTTEDGQTVTARKVIVTTPMNTWADINYEPSLSSLKLQVAKDRHAGDGNKVHIKLKQDIGNIFLSADDKYGPCQYAYTESTSAEGTILISYGWDGAFDVNNKEAVSTMVRKFLPDVEVDSVYGYQWRYDPFAKGTWCTLRPHQFGLIPQLQKAEGNIHFASSDIATMWRGWMSGAIEMGISTAHIVAKELVS